jgi:branched-chain amino acid transport system substrate-binding protein
MQMPRPFSRNSHVSIRKPQTKDDTMKQQHRVLAAFGLALAVTLVSLPAATRAADPLDIDTILPLTGQAAFVGLVEQKTLSAAEATVNKTGGIGGRQVRFVVKDDASNPQNTVQLVSEAVAKGDQVIIGPSLSSACGAALPILKNGPVSYCLSPGVHPPEGSYMFSADWSTSDTTHALVHYARERGWKRVAILSSTDSSGADGEKGIDAGLAAEPTLTVVAREHFAVADISVAAQLARIKAANPQVLITWASGSPFNTLIRGIADAGIDLPVMGSNSNLTFASMHQLSSYLPKELLFAAAITEATPETLKRGAERTAVEQYVTSLKAAGLRPEAGTILSWDAIWIVVGALRKFGPDAKAAQIRDYIASQKGLVGIHGTYDFQTSPQRGLDARGVVISHWSATRETLVPVSKPGGNI